MKVFSAVFAVLALAALSAPASAGRKASKGGLGGGLGGLLGGLGGGGVGVIDLGSLGGLGDLGGLLNGVLSEVDDLLDNVLALVLGLVDEILELVDELLDELDPELAGLLQEVLGLVGDNPDCCNNSQVLAVLTQIQASVKSAKAGKCNQTELLYLTIKLKIYILQGCDNVGTGLLDQVLYLVECILAEITNVNLPAPVVGALTYLANGLIELLPCLASPSCAPADQGLLLQIQPQVQLCFSDATTCKANIESIIGKLQINCA